MIEQAQLKLIVAYDANRNEYSIAAHNQTPEEAEAYVAQWTPHLRPGRSLITLDQAKRHQAEESSACRACRETVARSSGLEPPPKFTRRSE